MNLHSRKQDHRHVKRRFTKYAEFKNLIHTSRTIADIEIIHALYSKKRSPQRDSNFSTIHLLILSSNI